MSASENKHIDSTAALDASVEDQIARNMVELLDSHAQNLPESYATRLADARSLAIGKLVSRESELAGYSLHKNGHALQWRGGRWGRYFEQHRLLSTLLAICVVLFAVFAVQHLSVSHQIESSDAFLLASDLPPEAYADKGFNAWLDTN